MKTLALFCILAGLILSRPAVAQERDGNFNIRFEPTARMQSRIDVPFQIKVIDPRQKPVEHAAVTLQIKDRDNMNVKVYRTTMTAPGIYVASPSFVAAGEWSVYVEVRRDGEMTARTIQFTVSE